MGTLDEVRRLTDAARDVPPHEGRELFRSIRRRRARRRVASGAMGSVAVAMLAVLAWPGGGVLDGPVIDDVAGSRGGALASLAVPEQGSASATYLDDGTPVFVSHTEDGAVHVLDGLDPHLEGKLLVYCPDVDRFLEPRAGSTYLLDGTYAGGPSPADLSRWPAELSDDGATAVVVGSSTPSDGRSADQVDFTDIRCHGAVRHEPDTSGRDLAPRDALVDGRWAWAYVRLEEVAERSFVLCHALRGCADADDRLPTAIDMLHADSTPLWALLRRGADGVDARFAVRDIEINTGPPADDIEATRRAIGWAPRHLVGGIGVDGVEMDSDLRLRFDPEGWFSADLPCTTRYGRYELVADDTISFEDVRSTAGACDDEPLQVALERIFAEGQRTLVVAGNGLRLMTPDGGEGVLYNYSDDVGPKKEAPPPAPERCSDAPALSSLYAADQVADEVVLFAACPTAERAADTHTGPYFALGRGLPRDVATPAEIVQLYVEGLTPAEADDGYVLTRPDLTDGAISVIQQEETVTVSFAPEALGDNVSATYASTALLEEFGALFLQLPDVERVRFTLDGSCEDFAAAVQRTGDCVEVDGEQPSSNNDTP